MARFVALGDSLTEGTGDPHGGYPNGLRGWADLLATELARVDPGLEYANLALRAKRARDVLVEQVPAAVALRPTLVTLWVGGNDGVLGWCGGARCGPRWRRPLLTRLLT